MALFIDEPVVLIDRRRRPTPYFRIWLRYQCARDWSAL